jgi:uncharacterized protein involved in exopolysaccharide biosynthesis
VFDTENRDDRKRSLLAYAREGQGEDHAPRSGSLLAMADAGDKAPGDAPARHRAARLQRDEWARREAQGTGAATGLSETDVPNVTQAETSPRLADRISRWSPLSRLKGKAAEPAQDAPAILHQEPRETMAKAPVPMDLAEDDFSDFDESQDERQWKPLIDPMKVIGGIGKSKLLIVLCTVLGALLGVAIALSTPKKYETATELLIDPRDLKLVDRDLTQAGFSNEATLAIVENQVRVITSGTVLNKVVEQLHLDQDPEFNGQGKGGGLFSGVRSLFSHGSTGADDPGRRRALAINHLAENLSVERGGKTFVVVIRAKTEDGEKSALIANTMAEVFLKTYGELQSETAGRATDELTARLTELRSGVEAAERKVEAFKADNDIINPQGRLITDDELMKLNEQLSVARARTLELNARAASTKSMSVDAVLGGVLPEALASPSMTELRSQYAALKSEADRLAVRLGPRHPQLQAIEAQLSGARAQIDGELNRIVSSVQTELARSVQLEQELSSRMAQLKVRQGDVNRSMVTLRELEREATSRRAVYEAYLLRSRETGEQRDINTANMSIISRAFPPLQAERPSRSTIVMTSAMLGFFAGIGLGGLRGAYESLRDTAEDRRRRRARRGRKPRPQSMPSGGQPEDRPVAPMSQEHAPSAPTHQPYAPASSSPLSEASAPQHPAPAAPADASAAFGQPTGPESIEDIRASLRDFRQAVTELAEARTRRRYF